MDSNTVVILVGIVIAALGLSIIFLMIKFRPKVTPLPDGDYIVKVTEERETLQGRETVYEVESPEAFKGQRFTIRDKDVLAETLEDDKE